MTLGRNNEKLAADVGYADERYSKHLRNEADRARYGLVSDFSRWLKTGVARD